MKYLIRQREIKVWGAIILATRGDLEGKKPVVKLGGEIPEMK